MGNGNSRAKTNNDVGSEAEPDADAPSEQHELRPKFKLPIQNTVEPETIVEPPANNPQGPHGLPGMLKILLFSFVTVFIASCVHVNNELDTSRYEITKLQFQNKYSKNEISEMKASIANQKEYFEKSSKTSVAKVQAFQAELERLKNEIETLKITQCQCERSQSGDEGFGIWNSISSLNLISSDADDAFEEPHSKTSASTIVGIQSQTHFSESLRTLQGTFPSQTDDTWAQITSAVQSTMTDEQPPRPSSLLILFPQSIMDPNFPICFAQKLARSINEAFHVQVQNYPKNIASSSHPKLIDAHYFKSMPSLTSVHSDLKAYLSRNSGKAVIIQNLDQIQNEDQLMVLHAFCDNSDYMAFDTRANFIATLSVPDSILNGNENPALDWTHKNGGKISRNILNSVWKRVTSDDKRGAVISRVAGNVILLNEGDSCV